MKRQVTLLLNRYASASRPTRILALASMLLAAALANAAPQPVGTVESALRQAELLLQTNKNDEALQVLRSARMHAGPDDAVYWQLYGDQAWERQSRPEALSAYQAARKAGSDNAQVLERLIQHYNANGEPQLAIAVGQQAYQRLAEPRWLLLAMDAATQASLWDALSELARQAQADEGKFSDSEMYWLLQALSAHHDADKPRARHAYDRALALNPDSVPTRAQVLWFEIDKGDSQRLAGHLADWQQDAQVESAYWSAYAVALLQLDRVDESLDWYDRQVRHKPDDYLWQLGYFSALARTGQLAPLDRLRGDLLLRLRGNLTILDALPKADARVVLLAYAEMVRNADGPVAGDQVLRDVLARGHADAAVYQMLVASSLAQKNFDAAHDWLLRAEAERQQLPAYQLLAVALAREDSKAIDRVLVLREADLSVPDRVTALRQLERNVLALSLTEKSLLQAQDDATDLLRQHRDQLRVRLASWAEAGYEHRSLSDLKIERSEVAASVADDRGRATLRLAHNTLRSNGGNLSLAGFQSENDLSLLTELLLGKDPVRLTLGVNQRADKSLTYGRLEWSRALGPRLNGRLEVLLNGLTEETSAMRAIGAKNKVSLGLGGSLTDRTYGRLELAAQQFNTRKGDVLGKGYRAEGEIGTAVSSRFPAWQARISGSSEKNQLADRLPAGLVGSVLPPSQVLENVLSRRFSTLGIGSTLRLGQPADGQRRLHGLLDGWIGRQWPANDRAYSLRAAVSIPVVNAGQVRAEAFYTNVQGGVSSQANRGMRIWYRHEF